MNRICKIIICVLLLSQTAFSQINSKNYFPDGTPIPKWFSDTTKVDYKQLGKSFVITDFGAVNDSTLLQTKAIQKAIDEAAKQGGVVVIPKGVFMSGALFFKPKTHLYVSEGATLKGSDDIANYPKIPSRMEGQCLDYFAALVNVYGVNGFTISGKGTIDGNGLNFWKAFWQRRKENPKCTNLEVSRPRLVFVWNCNNVQFQDVKLHNSGFWTNHFYKCKNVKFLNLHITSPREPVKAPSTDAIDLDICSNVLVKNCYMAVNDDAVVLKGGKGPWAEKDTANGGNENILVENCEYGFCHSAFTCGSEAIHNKNVLIRNCVVNNPQRVLWLKMRPDTQQKYEYISIENIKGTSQSFLDINPWTQFFDLKGRTEPIFSTCENISLKNINVECKIFYDVKSSDKYQLSNFSFENIDVKSEKPAFDRSFIKGNSTVKNVKINGIYVK